MKIYFLRHLFDSAIKRDEYVLLQTYVTRDEGRKNFISYCFNKQISVFHAMRQKRGFSWSQNVLFSKIAVNDLQDAIIASECVMYFICKSFLKLCKFYNKIYRRFLYPT